MSAPRTIAILADARSIHTQRWANYFVRRGDKVNLLSLEPGEGDAYTYQRLRSRLPVRGFKYVAAVPSLRQKLSRMKPDIVNAHFVPNYGLLGLLAGFRPLVVTCWGSDVLLSPLKSGLHRRRVERVIRGADFLTSDSAYLTDRLVAFGAFAEKIATVPLGVEDEILALGAERHHSGDEKVVVLSTRQLEPVYDVETVLHTVPKAIMGFPHEMEFWIVGAGSQRRTLETLSHAIGVSLWTKFLGWLERPRYLEVLRQAAVYVSTARSDSTSVSLLEAMGAGLAPVVADIPGNREWITDGENGFLVPVDSYLSFGEKIRFLADRSELRQQFAVKNQQIIRAKARWQENMQVISELFDRLIGTKGQTFQTAASLST